MACGRIHQFPRDKCSYHQMTDESRPSSSLQNLGCCQDLFRYYEKKLEKYEIDYAVLDTRLQEINNTFNDYYQLQMQLAQRDDEIATLQRALSDLQIVFIDEQAKSNQYEVEIKVLKIQENECRKQLEHLMRNRHENEEQETQYCYNHCTELMKQIQALKEQIEVNYRINEQQKDTFIRDRQIRIEETMAAQKRDAHQIRSLTNKLRKTQELLNNTTDEYFKINRDNLAKEKQKLQQKEMLYYTDGYSKPCCETPTYISRPSVPIIGQRIHKAEKTFRKKEPMQPKPCSRYTSRNATIQTQEPKEAVQNELVRWKKKFEALEKRRQLEINGFQTDIKLLRNQLNSIEKQLFKLFDNRNSGNDGAVLRVIHQTETQSKRISDSIRAIKRQIYTMENQLRCI